MLLNIGTGTGDVVVHFTWRSPGFAGFYRCTLAVCKRLPPPLLADRIVSGMLWQVAAQLKERKSQLQKYKVSKTNPNFRTVSKSVPSSNRASQDPSADLSQLIEVVHAAAQSRKGDSVKLLALLRLLNELHYEIRDTLFRDALPDNRQHLYRLLKDIEQEGGWPYITRMKLTALLEHIEEANEPDDEEAEKSATAAPEA